MSLVCTTVTTWITREILDRVDKWEDRQEQRCKKLPWWNPLKWLCWLVTITVLVTSWIIRYIVVPIIKIICEIVSFVVGWILTIGAIMVDAVCQRCNAVRWVDRWFKQRTKIIFKDKVDSSNIFGSFFYTFICNCNPFKTPEITVTASNDEQAAELAKVECEKLC